MIEIIDYGLQMALITFCINASVLYMMRMGNRQKAWILLILTGTDYLLGDLYWTLFLIFYGETAPFSYIPYLSWYTCYIFLFLLVAEVRSERRERKFRPLLLIVPAFTGGMCIFFLQWGDVIGNTFTVVLRTLPMWQALDGLLAIRDGQEKKEKRFFFLAVMAFCLAEYGTDTASCFWMGDTIRNPYFWIDMVLAATFVVFPRALRKAVEQ